MPGPVSSHLAGVQRRLTTVGNDIAIAAGQAVAQGITAQLAADGAPLSRYRGGGAPRVDARPQGANTAEVVPTSGAGQIGILEQGARPHTIGGGRRVLAFQGGGFASGAVNHPGAPAKGSWSTGVERGEPQARTAAQAEFATVLDG